MHVHPGEIHMTYMYTMVCVKHNDFFGGIFNIYLFIYNIHVADMFCNMWPHTFIHTSTSDHNHIFGLFFNESQSVEPFSYSQSYVAAKNVSPNLHYHPGLLF